MICESRNKRLDWLIGQLMNDVPQARGIGIPADTVGKRQLLRVLMNVREPKAVTEEFLAVQDAELQCQLREKGAVRLDGDGIDIWQGDITRLAVDGIVNAANSQLLGCFVPLHGCIDNAIHSAAGVQLRLACAEIMARQGSSEPAGQAKITAGFNLPTAHVIHTVGPIVYGDEPTADDRALLAQCYRSCLRLADETGLKSLALCCISTGEFRFPNRLAAQIAVDEVRRFLPSAKHLHHVIFNVFKDVDKTIYEELLGKKCVAGQPAQD